MVWSTLSRSRVELSARLTSPSAVSCPTDRVSSCVRAWSSVSSRAFSTAMTAWSANVWSSAISAGEKAPASRRVTLMAPMGCPSRSIGAQRVDRHPRERARSRIAWSRAGSDSVSGMWMTVRSAMQRAGGGRPGHRPGRLRSQVLLRPGHAPTCRNEVEELTVEPEDPRRPRPEEAHGVVHDGVEHRLHLGLRLADHPQDIRGGGLALERLANLCMRFGERTVPFLQLLEQPHVLDRDDRLVRERLQQLDLVLLKRFDDS